MQALHINGNNLTIEDVRQVVYERRPVLLQPEARHAVDRARAIVDDLVESERVAYAVNTGVGHLADVRISRADIRQLQTNLIRSHCCGSWRFAIRGSDARHDVAACELAGQGIFRGTADRHRHIVRDAESERASRYSIPGKRRSQWRPRSAGALGAGLDWRGRRRTRRQASVRSQAMARAQIKPLVLEAKEAISLINGTQAMLAIGLLAVMQIELLADTADVVGALTLDALKGTDVAFDERIHRARPHPGQLLVAQNLRRMLEGSVIRESHIDCQKVQDAYALRCMPQVHGAVRDTLAHCREVFEIEMNSAVDNPLVFPEEKKVGAPKRPVGASVPGVILSGGNFHGEPLAFALDFLAIALSALSGISERRLERLINPALNEGLPAFLAPGAGLNSGFMMPQVTAAALVNENKVLSHPASSDSISTSGNKEDFVSMGMTSANKLLRVVTNTRNVLAIEALAAAQAHDFRTPLQTSKRGQIALNAIRAVSPPITEDRVFAPDFVKVADVIAQGKLAAALR